MLHVSQIALIAGSKAYGIDFATQFNGTIGHFTRTPGVAGNLRKYTIHWEFQRHKLGVNQAVLSASTGGGTATLFEVYIDTTDVMIVYINGVERLKTTQVFRDVGGVYSGTLRVDTDNATAASKLILEIGLTMITSFSVDNRASLSGDTSINATTMHYYGSYLGSLEFTHDTRARFVIVDGALHPASDFIELDVATGQYKAKVFTIPAYGTNGCYLDHALPGTGSLGNDLGKDVSGNGNHWTATGVTQITSTPTNVYATLNPLFVNGTTPSAGFLTQGNLHFDPTSGHSCAVAMLRLPSTGIFRMEVTVTTIGTSAVGIGIGDADDYPASANCWLSYDAGTRYVGYAYLQSGVLNVGPSDTTDQSGGATYTTADVIDVVADADAGTCKWYKNGTLQYTKSGLTISDWVFAVACYQDAVLDVNFGQNAWANSISGYDTGVALCTDNLPARSPKVPTTPQTGNVVCNGTTNNAFILLNMVPDKAGVSTVDGITLVPGTNCIYTATGVKLTSAVFTAGTKAYSIAVKAYTGGSNVPPANAQVNP